MHVHPSENQESNEALKLSISNIFENKVILKQDNDKIFKNHRNA